jgi:hypothetical protein
VLVAAVVAKADLMAVLVAARQKSDRKIDDTGSCCTTYTYM